MLRKELTEIVMPGFSWRVAAAVVALPLVLAGCDEDEDVAAVEEIRSIKFMTLDERAGDQQRRIAGVVSASISTNVAFETAGRVIELINSAGDEVEQGDLIARLDPEPFEIQVAQAQASLAQAVASLDDAEKKFAQQERLFSEGFATRTALDSATATLKNAEGAVGVSRSQLDVAERNLTKTELLAPFTGVISRKEVEVFEEVSGGQAIYAMQTAGEDKIDGSLPETLINTVSLGTPVEITFPPLEGVSVTGSITEISPLTGDANAYPIEITLDETPAGLRAGMSAEIVFQFESEETGVAFAVPMSAVLPDPNSSEGFVFVYNPESQTLTKRDVTVGNVRDNMLLILGDLEPGVIIATAGVSFLHDGMQVELFDPEILR